MSYKELSVKYGVTVNNIGKIICDGKKALK